MSKKKQEYTRPNRSKQAPLVTKAEAQAVEEWLAAHAPKRLPSACAHNAAHAARRSDW